MQEPGIRIARRKGWRVILADGNPHAHGRDLADRFECIDLKDKDGLLAFARSVHGRRRAGRDFYRGHGFFLLGRMGGGEDRAPRHLLRHGDAGNGQVPDARSLRGGGRSQSPLRRWNGKGIPRPSWRPAWLFPWW